MHYAMAKKNQMHALFCVHGYEMSYKCQLYTTHTVAIIVAILIHNYFESPNSINLCNILVHTTLMAKNSTVFIFCIILYYFVLNTFFLSSFCTQCKIPSNMSVDVLGLRRNHKQFELYQRILQSYFTL
jgi:hypothetical protein